MQPRQNQGNRPNVSAALNREWRVLFRSYVICSIAHASWRGLGWRAALALCAVAFFACGMASAQDKGILNPQPLPPLAKPDDPHTPARELFAQDDAHRPSHALHRLLLQRLSDGGRCIAYQRRDLASDASLA